MHPEIQKKVFNRKNQVRVESMEWNREYFEM